MPSGSAADHNRKWSGNHIPTSLGASVGGETSSEQPSTRDGRNVAQRLIWKAVLIALLAICDGTGASADGSLEFAVKATFLYKFAPFVDWPDFAFASPTSLFNLCLVGDDPFGGLVDQATAGRQIGARPIVVRHLHTIDGPEGCQIMFVANSNAQSAQKVLEIVRGAAVLTVTDSITNGTARGVIHFIILDNRVRFDIDDNLAAQDHLTISSKLLSLAHTVQPRMAAGR